MRGLRVLSPVRIRRLRGLSVDRRGVTTIEFAIVAPVFLMMVIGCLDVGQMVYAKGVLDGAVEKAARDSSLETGDIGLADSRVENVIKKVLPGATVSSTRKSYFDFVNANKGEKLNDTNGDGECSTGESYTDSNGNQRWDEDLGKDGNGGANDVIVYTVTVAYEPTFQVPLVPLDWSRREITSTAVKRNQPFALQTGSYSSQVRTC
ncbi:pilus assembly protein [Novosphingobium sp. ERN07]|nr:TadE/TadG family type IV pilus assembly protein [Novosphingobium sp. ERN07]NLR72518.1 pilus assembly protein [Novosphingobium sp. ERN07]